VRDGLELEYRQAVERERLIRDAAYLPVTERIGPFEVRAMTLQDYLALRLVGSPFICGGPRDSDGIAAFLWLLAPDYAPGNLQGKRRMERACRGYAMPGPPRVHLPWLMRRRARGAARAAVACASMLGLIEDYVAETVQDRPATSSGEEGASYFSEAAGLIDTFAAEYGWADEVILGMPLKRLFQQLKIINARRRAASGRATMMFNPSDAVRGRMLEALNGN
jgi:hypothetical protein